MITCFKKFKKIGNLGTNNEFANIIVNGVSWGVMNIEEHMSKELIEKQSKKDSLLLKFRMMIITYIN